MTFEELVDYFMKEYKLEVTIVSCNRLTLAMSISPSFKNKMKIKIEDEYAKQAKCDLKDIDNLALEVSADCEDGITTALLPIVLYKFK